MATITGTAGDDVFHGDGADNIYTGGGGHDQYVFNGAFGLSQIVDFEAGVDQIVLQGLTSNAEITLTYGTDMGPDHAVHPVTYVSAQDMTGFVEIWGLQLAAADVTAPGSDTGFGPAFIFIGGTDNADVIHAGAAKSVFGFAGNDVIYADNHAVQLSGGNGDDILYGSPFADYLDGDFGWHDHMVPGNDILYGGDGDDELTTRGGNDTLDGGSGYDMADFAIDHPTQGEHIDLSLDGVAQDTGVGVMTLRSIEWVDAGTPFDDVLTAAGMTTGVVLSAGYGGHDILIGGSGDDSITTMGGSGTLTGGAGRDFFQVITWQSGNTYDASMTNFDTITDFQTGVDTLDANAERATIVNNPAGGAVVWLDLDGDDVDDTKVVLTTGHISQTDMSISNRTVIEMSNSGDDVISMSVSNWSFYGGDNFASYAGATAGVHVSLALMGQAQDTIGAGHDTLIGLSGLIGSSFADVLTGDGARNVLTGGAGADIFIMTKDGTDPAYAWQVDHGADTITDFNAAEGDRIDVTAFGITSLAQILAGTAQQGSDTVLTLGASQVDMEGVAFHNSVTLTGVDLASLTAADFIFAPGPGAYQGAGSGPGLAFRNAATGDWGFMSVGPSGEVWHAIGPTSTAYGAIGTGDFNGDGVIDIAFRSTSTGAWGFMTANPSGGETWHDVGATSLGYASMGAGDFNGDGVADIAFRDTATGDWGFMSVNPAGGETWRPGGATSTAYAAVGVGDFDGDGRSDIAFRSIATGDWGFMSAGSWSGEAWHGVGPTSTQYDVMGIGDFNGDGVTDIAFRQATTGDWGFMSVNPAGGEVWRGVGPTSTAYAAVMTGDFDSDSRTDIAFRNPLTGDWGYMAYNPAGGEIWHGVGPTSTAYQAIA